MAWRYRKALGAYKRSSRLQIKEVLTLDPVALQEKGIKVIVLDLDGVLAAHGENCLSPAIGSWINLCVQTFGIGKVFILSNQATKIRARYFAQNFKGVVFIVPARKKPYPDGILQVLQSTKVTGSAVLVIDDRLLTGILAALLTNTAGYYVVKPFICWRKRPIRESFFVMLRSIERLLL